MPYCESAWGPDADRHAMLLINREAEGSLLEAYLHPADFPVEQPVVFEFIVNLKTAAALGLNIREAVVNRADRVFE